MGTVTTDFGTSKRESHDSSPFYSRFGELPASRIVGPIQEPPEDALNVILNKSSEQMLELPDNCVSLMVTSPPYHVGKEYDTDTDFDEYLDLLYTVFSECYRVLQPGGRAAINLANIGRKPYIPLTTFCDAVLQDIGFLPRGEIIWVKAKGASGSCAFGSYMSASNPVLRDVHEYIMVYSKGQYGKPYKGESTLTKRTFLRDTLSVWEFPPESAKRIGHPAPFPIELPRRLMNLYTYKNDLILDPFVGAGTTALAAIEGGRNYIGYDTSQDYVEIAESRIDALEKKLERNRKAAEHQRELWAKDPEGMKTKARDWRAKRMVELRERTNDIKLESGCVDCGYNFAPEALDFDHVKGEKIEGVSFMVGKLYSWEKIQEEIDKCVVRCANCHRIKTFAPPATS